MLGYQKRINHSLSLWRIEMAKRTQIIDCKIIRRTSKYNKYIKWFAECYHADGSLLSSFGYRTRREALQSLTAGFPITIGKDTVQTEYNLLEGD